MENYRALQTKLTNIEKGVANQGYILVSQQDLINFKLKEEAKAHDLEQKLQDTLNILSLSQEMLDSQFIKRNKKIKYYKTHRDGLKETLMESKKAKKLAVEDFRLKRENGEYDDLVTRNTQDTANDLKMNHIQSSTENLSSSPNSPKLSPDFERLKRDHNNSQSSNTSNSSNSSHKKILGKKFNVTQSENLGHETSSSSPKVGSHTENWRSNKVPSGKLDLDKENMVEIEINDESEKNIEENLNNTNELLEVFALFASIFLFFVA